MIVLLLGCSTGSISVGDDTAPPVDTDTTDTDTTDTDTIDTDTTDTDTTDSDTTETIPDAPDTTPDATFDPPGATFVDTITVTLSVKDGQEAWYTTDGSLPTDGDEPYTGPIELRAGAELRALVRTDAGLEDLGAASFIRVDDELASFSSNLPLLVLFSEDTLPESGESYSPVSFQVHEPGDDGRAALVGTASISTRAAIQVRGSSTAYDDKHSYALELRETGSDDDRDVELLGMPADSDWVLYAPTGFDRALMRNALMYQLSNDAGRYAPRTRFVEVFATGRGRTVTDSEYIGVYTLMERVKRGPDRVAITELTAEDVSPPEVTGGYLFKRDREGEGEYGFWAGESGGTFYFASPLIYVDPEEDVIEPEQATYIYDTVDTFANTLVAGGDYSDLIDTAAWVDHHILNLYPKNPDALRLSAYMYKDREGPIVAGPIWDFDRSMGCDDDDRAYNPEWWDPTNQTWDTTPMFTYGWYQALFDDPDFTVRYWARWSELLDGALSVDHVDTIVEEMAAELDEAADRNFERWPDYAPARSYRAEVDELLTWLDARHAWIADCIATHPDPELCTGD